MNPESCLLCGLNSTPKGKTISGRFNCSSCNKEWILEKRTKTRFPKKNKALEVNDLLIEFLTIYDSELEMNQLCFKTLSILKNKFNLEKIGFMIHDNLNHFLKFNNFISNIPKNESFLTKLKISTKNSAHPYIQAIYKNEVFVTKIDKKKEIGKLYNKITNSKFQILFPVIHKTKLLGLITIDFDSKPKANKVFKQKDIIELIIKEFAVALNHTILFTKATTKYKQYEGLHSSGLTLNKLYLNNTAEIIRMSLLTISGIIETDLNILLVHNKKFNVVTSHKLLRTLTTFDFDQNSIILDNHEKYKRFFGNETAISFKESDEIVLTELGFKGREVLNLTSFQIEVNEYVFLLGRSNTLLFSIDDIEVLSAYNDLVKMTIENAFLYFKMTKQERLEKEVEIAKEIQLNLLPSKMPELKLFDITGVMEPAREIGGDYYDILISPNQKEILFAIGDVSGKGLPAGMVMVTARTIIHSVIRRLKEVSQIMKELNSYLYYNYKNSATTRFMSMICLLWNEDENEFTFAGGGHGDFLIYRKKTNQIETIFTGGTILGIIPDIERTYSEGKIKLEEGDSILLFTDGVTETQNIKGEMYEQSRLIESFLKNANKSSEEILNSIKEDLKEFSKNMKTQHDDITMLLIKKN
jgi:phosphoserine phosphatase RsbU/P